MCSKRCMLLSSHNGCLMHVVQAALLCASGDPEGAMLRLLSAQHRTSHLAANTTAPSAGSGVTPTGTGQQSNVREAGSGAADVDPFALDFLLRCGLYRLAGKEVPADLAARLAGLARGAAAALGEAGLPGAALEAMLAAARLTKAQPQGHANIGSSYAAGSGDGSHCSGGGGASGAGGHTDPDAREIADARDYEWLLAAALAPRAAAAAAAAAAGALHSSEDGIRSGERSPTNAPMPQNAARQGAHVAGAAHSTTPGAHADEAGASATAAAAVAAAVRPVLQGALQAVDGVLDCTPGAVLAALVAHAAGTVLADEWPLLPPPQLRHPPSTSLARSPGQQAFGGGGASAPVGAPGARAHPRRSSHDAGHHPSRSPPGASRAGSHRSHHQGVAHQQGLSRRSSTSQPPTPGSSVASACSSTAALTTFAPLFEEPLEVISVEGDKCFAATCSGIITPDGHGRPFAVATGTSS